MSRPLLTPSIFQFLRPHSQHFHAVRTSRADRLPHTGFGYGATGAGADASDSPHNVHLFHFPTNIPGTVTTTTPADANTAPTASTTRSPRPSTNTGNIHPLATAAAPSPPPPPPAVALPVPVDEGSSLTFTGKCVASALQCVEHATYLGRISSLCKILALALVAATTTISGWAPDIVNKQLLLILAIATAVLGGADSVFHWTQQQELYAHLYTHFTALSRSQDPNRESQFQDLQCQFEGAVLASYVMEDGHKSANEKTSA